MKAEDLAQLHTKCFDHSPPPWSADSFRALLADPAVCLVYRDAGFALARTAAGEAELLTIAVHPDARRKGTGFSLLQDLTSKLAALGADEIFCEVSALNEAAISLYEAFGFARVGRRKGYYQTSPEVRSDALVMRKPIRSDSAKNAVSGAEPL